MPVAVSRPGLNLPHPVYWFTGWEGSCYPPDLRSRYLKP